MPSFRDAFWFVTELVDPDAEGERERRILKKGRRAAGRVLEWKQWGRVGTGSTSANMRLRIRVEAQGLEPYEISGSYPVPDHCLGLIDQGVLDIAIDPKQPDRIALDWELAQMPVVVEHPDGERRFDLAKNLAAKREVVEIVRRHGEDLRENAQAREEAFEVLRRHGYSVDTAQ